MDGYNSFKAESHGFDTMNSFSRRRRNSSEHDSFGSEDDLAESDKAVLTEEYDRNIRPFIDLVDEMRDLGLDQDVDLPTVVVVGDQSSGKSSILEAISGIQLPRGAGMVTRCPLEMQMIRAKSGTWKARLSYKDKTEKTVIRNIDDPQTVDQHILAAQDEMAGHGRSISTKPITLRIESKNAPDLTLIDLPGIVRLALDGQVSTLPVDIKNLVKSYIEKSNAVILCVISGELDIAVNESINLAQEVDPDGTRTLGVITKPDLIQEDDKRHKLELLHNKVKPLTKGYTMLLCRSSHDVQEGMTLKEALERENKFFQRDPIFKEADKSLIGSKNLSSKLTIHLVELIKLKIPDLKQKVEKMLERAKRDVDRMPPGPPTEKAKKYAYYIKIYHEYMTEVQKCLERGEFEEDSDINMFSKWRRIYDECKDRIKSHTSTFLSDDCTPEKLMETIRKKRGEELSRFLNFNTFKKLLIDHFTGYKQFTTDCSRKIERSVGDCVARITQRRIETLPKLRKRIDILAQTSMKAKSEELKQAVDLLFKAEELIFSQDDSFGQEKDRLEQEEREREELERSQTKYNKHMTYEVVIESEEMKNAREMHRMITAYLGVANRRFVDIIPQYVRVCLQNNFVETLRAELEKLGSDENFTDLIEESPRVAQKRDHLEKRLNRLEAGYWKLHSFPSIGLDEL